MNPFIFLSCAATDVKSRRQPLANALNVVLKEFRTKQYGMLPANAGRWDKEEVVFLPNDPTLTTTRSSSGASLLKPDIIAVYYGCICDRRMELRELDYEQMLAAIADGSVRKAEMKNARKEGKKEEEESDDSDEELPKEALSDEMEYEEEKEEPEMESRQKISWVDAHQPWKLKANEKTKLSFIERVWSAGDKKLNIVSTEQAESNKEAEEGDGKESKSGWKEEKKKEVALDVQSYTFASERLSSSWIMGQCTTVTVEGTTSVSNAYIIQSC